MGLAVAICENWEKLDDCSVGRERERERLLFYSERDSGTVLIT